MQQYPYLKPHLTLSQQVDLLTERGLHIPDRVYAERHLAELNYYRLSAYWFSFREILDRGPPLKRDETFIHGTSFNDVIQLYKFDRDLKRILLSPIEQIEIAVRTSIAYHLGEQDPYAHLNPTYIHGHFLKNNCRSSEFDQWKEQLSIKIERSREEFISRFKEKYAGKIPIWVSVELWDFGTLSKFYKMMRHNDKTSISKTFGVEDPLVFASWLRTINYIRNIVAHHSILWNKNIVDQPKLPKDRLHEIFKITQGQRNVERIYITICILNYLTSQIDSRSHWHTEITQLINSFPTTNMTNITHMGFPSDWEGF